jgi:hypothetical protein
MEDTAVSVLNIMNIMSFHLLQNSKPNPPIPGRPGLFRSVGLKMMAVWYQSSEQVIWEAIC